MNENELEKHEMKLIVEETLSKYRGSESSIFESESKRIALQKEYERVLSLYNNYIGLFII
jgi:hypothetical protein